MTGALASETLPCREIQWPGVEQVVKCVRMGEAAGQGTTQTHGAITILPRNRASAADLFSWQRVRWGVENCPFHVGYATLRDDASRIRTGQRPRLMTAVRNAAIDSIGSPGGKNIAAGLRANAVKVHGLTVKLAIFKN